MAGLVGCAMMPMGAILARTRDAAALLGMTQETGPKSALVVMEDGDAHGTSTGSPPHHALAEAARTRKRAGPAPR